MRIAFAGTPDVAVPSLTALLASQHEVVTVLTRADAPVGRRRVITPSPVAAAAAGHGLPSIRTNRLDDEVTRRIVELDVDLGVIVAYGALLREPLLSTPRLGWINLHFSLLPRWRGAAPVQHSILAGDDTTGVSVFQLEAGMDTGPIFGQTVRPIGARETSGHLLGALAEEGAGLLVSVVDALSDGTARAAAQSGEATTARKLALDDGRIEWSADAASIDARVRAVTPEPGAFTLVAGQRLKILEAAIARDTASVPPGAILRYDRAILVGTSTDPIELLRVHPAGRKAMSAADWWRGLPAHDGGSAHEGLVAE